MFGDTTTTRPGRHLYIIRSPSSYFEPSSDVGMWNDWEQTWPTCGCRKMDNWYDNYNYLDVRPVTPLFDMAVRGMPVSGQSRCRNCPTYRCAARFRPYDPLTNKKADQIKVDRSEVKFSESKKDEKETEPSQPDQRQVNKDHPKQTTKEQTDNDTPSMTMPLYHIIASSLNPFLFKRRFDSTSKIDTTSSQKGEECGIITAPDGSKTVKFTADVRQFKPDEISVKTEGNDVLVTAKHDNTTDNSRLFMEFHRRFALPPGVEPESLKSFLSAEGVLSIEGPIQPPPAIAQKTAILITIMKTDDGKNSDVKPNDDTSSNNGITNVEQINDPNIHNECDKKEE